MRWSERQRAMLQAMGLTLWAPPQTPADSAAAAATARTAGPVRAAVAPPAAQAGVDAVADRDARAREIAALDWTALRERVASCRACKLCEGRRHTVFGVGHPQAHWMIVGEAPGEQEDRLGEPFVGPAGELLDRMLQALGLTRGEAGPERQVFIANTLKCRPPRNRNPEPEELALCGAFLQRQIELVNPKLILAMGRFAVQMLLASSEPIGRLRGRVHRYRERPVVVTYHPAYLLRSPAEKARSWADLCLAAAQLPNSQELSPHARDALGPSSAAVSPAVGDTARGLSSSS
ncbi:MAG: uracil-DNA glycosylase [Burkholderiaceae bacterium]